MSNALSTFDISHELVLEPYQGGVRLARPINSSPSVISNVFKLPYSLWFNDHHCVTQQANEGCVEICGYDSLQECIGTSPLDSLERESALADMFQQQSVIKNKKIKMYEEIVIRSKDHALFNIVTVAFPFYDNDNNVTGLFGCTMNSGAHKISEFFNSLCEIGLLHCPKPKTGFILELTSREKDCVKLVMQGIVKTREMANILGLSQRTVEHYIESIKHKMKVKTKTELVLKLLESSSDLS